jgi:creatinine amidohydrolase/Fe(II)-dependent formamide hydrolase-like protein
MTSRVYGRLAAPDIDKQLGAHSILCLPIGSYEQHGPHLPLQTDTVIAECFADRLVARYGDEFDLWALPVIPYGLSLEHAWSAGTISLTTRLLVRLLDAVVHLDRIPADYAEDTAQSDLIRRYVLDRGTTWPWTSRDPRLSAIGIMGSDPRAATRELGEAVIESALDQCRDVLAALTKQG